MSVAVQPLPPACRTNSPAVPVLTRRHAATATLPSVSPTGAPATVNHGWSVVPATVTTPLVPNDGSRPPAAPGAAGAHASASATATAPMRAPRHGIHPDPLKAPILAHSSQVFGNF